MLSPEIKGEFTWTRRVKQSSTSRTVKWSRRGHWGPEKITCPFSCDCRRYNYEDNRSSFILVLFLWCPYGVWKITWMTQSQKRIALQSVFLLLLVSHQYYSYRAVPKLQARTASVNLVPTQLCIWRLRETSRESGWIDIQITDCSIGCD